MTDFLASAAAWTVSLATMAVTIVVLAMFVAWRRSRREPCPREGCEGFIAVEKGGPWGVLKRCSRCRGIFG